MREEEPGRLRGSEQRPIRGSKGDSDVKTSGEVAFVVLLSAAALAAQPAGHRSGPRVFGPIGAVKGGGISPACIEALGLTDGERTSLAGLRQNLETTLEPLFGQRRSYHDQIETALGAETPDPAAIGRLVIADHGVAAEIRAAHDRFVAAFQALLTPDQLTNLAALRDNGVCAPQKGPH
jgi:Heavy-metal resistance